MNVQKETLVMGLLAVLVLIAAVQAFQLMSISGVKAPSIGSTSAAIQSAPSSGNSVPQGSVSLQDLPNMVGGC